MEPEWQASCRTILDTNQFLLETGKLSDITFIIGEEEQRIDAHKLILASRSPVFEVMFQRWNPKDSEIILTDTTLPTFKHFLKVCFTINLF